MNVINLSGDEHLLRLKSALLRVSHVLSDERYRQTRIYRMALARRFTVCYAAFLTYLVSRVRMYEDAHEDLGMYAIVQRCRQYRVLDVSDERMVIQMSMLYVTLSYVSEGFDGKSDALLADIPKMIAFLESFIVRYEILPLQSTPVAATIAGS